MKRKHNRKNKVRTKRKKDEKQSYIILSGSLSILNNEK